MQNDASGGVPLGSFVARVLRFTFRVSHFALTIGRISRGAATKLYPRSIHRRLTLAELERRCQKPNHRQVGNWMARYVARPMALRVTWLLAPTGVSAHAATCSAIAAALLAAVCLATGGMGFCVAGAMLLQVWYLLDHVDGQLARLRGSSSLDGLQFDYLMHHVVNLVLPCSLGYGLWKNSGAEIWLLAGLIYAIGLLLLALANDTRCKALVDRLEESGSHPVGRLSVARNRTQRPPRRSANRQTPPPDSLNTTDGVLNGRYNRLVRRIVHLARKLCEIHVVMNAITILAFVQYAAEMPWLMQCYVALMAPLAIATAVATIARDIRRGAAEGELNRWLATDASDGTEPSHDARGSTSRDRPLLSAAASSHGR